MGSATAAALRQLGVRLSEEELDKRIAHAVLELAARRPVGDPRTEFTEHERAVLTEAGFDLTPLGPDEEDPTLRAAERYAALLATALTVQEAAARLRVDGSRVRQRLLARQLYGIRLPRGWLLPLFQFDDNRLVPGIDRVLPRLDPGLHPLVVATWFTTPQPDLYRPDDPDERPISPRDWLLIGGSPDIVADLAEDAGGYR